MCSDLAFFRKFSHPVFRQRPQSSNIYICSLQSNAVHATSAKSRFQWSVIWPWLVIYDPLKALLCCISLHTNSYQAISTHFHDIIPVQCSFPYRRDNHHIHCTISNYQSQSFDEGNMKVPNFSHVHELLESGSLFLGLRISRSNIRRRYYGARWVVLVYIQKQPASIVKSWGRFPPIYYLKLT